MRDVAETIETDRRIAAQNRRIAAQSTYGSCVCGPEHVPGCKTRRTEVLFILAVATLVAALGWWFFTIGPLK